MATPPPPPGTSPASPGPVTGATASRKGLSKEGWLIAVGVIAVVVGIVFAVLLIPGVFSSSSSTPRGPTYHVAFYETGLPAGTSWSVTLGGFTQPSTTAWDNFSEPNGTYGFTVLSPGYRASLPSGSLSVRGLGNLVRETFTALPPGTYVVTFTESGLPTGTSWSVTFNGTRLFSTTSTIPFTSKNGSWPFSVGVVDGYMPSPASGDVLVSGGPASQTITFTSGTTYSADLYDATPR